MYGENHGNFLLLIQQQLVVAQRMDAHSVEQLQQILELQAPGEDLSWSSLLGGVVVQGCLLVARRLERALPSSPDQCK